MGIYKAEAIVLRTRKYSEADQLVTLFSRQRGKIPAIAKGVRKVKSRRRGGVQPFTHGAFVLYEGRSLDHITQGDVIDAFPALTADLDRLAYASYITELVDGLVEEGQQNEKVFLLLLTTLHLMTTEDPEILTRVFEMRLTNFLGYCPELDSCVNCGGELGTAVRFSPELGGVLCGRCLSHDPMAARLTPATLAVMKQLLKMDLRRLGVLKVNQGIRSELEKLLNRYLDLRLERRLRSRDFVITVKETGSFSDVVVNVEGERCDEH
ncbi:MAG: DNA repair protein RecO [Clostridia bacterium]|nr:DNA repair protein RecO [Clostridia bacterium]